MSPNPPKKALLSCKFRNLKKHMHDMLTIDKTVFEIIGGGGGGLSPRSLTVLNTPDRIGLIVIKITFLKGVKYIHLLFTISD